MNQTILAGHAPAVRASRALRTMDVRKKCASALALRKSINPVACLSVAVIATAALFVALGLQCVPAVFVSGLTALLATAVAPISRKGGES